MNDLNFIKREIEKVSGVPASLLTGETWQENINQAKAIINYKNITAEKRTPTTSEQFARWINPRLGIENIDTTTQALATLEIQAKQAESNFPFVADKGETTAPDGRSTVEKFGEWASNKLSYDPFKTGDGWRRLL